MAAMWWLAAWVEALSWRSLQVFPNATGVGMIDEVLVAVTRDRAAELAGLSVRQVEYWSTTGLIKPTVCQRLTSHRQVRLYGFLDLLALMVAAELRKRGVSLQHIRVIVARLGGRGYEAPLTELRFATEGQQVYFQHPDGSWESGEAPDQVVLPQVLDLRPLRARLARIGERDASRIGRVERRRGVLGSKPVLSGTRVPVETVRRYLESGRSVDDILRAFPVLDRDDVEAVRQMSIA